MGISGRHGRAGSSSSRVSCLARELGEESRVRGSAHSEGVDLLLNVHSLYVIHERVLRAPRIGCFNCILGRFQSMPA